MITTRHTISQSKFLTILGLSQGDPLSCNLFYLIMQAVIRRAGADSVQFLAYADEIDIIGTSKRTVFSVGLIVKPKCQKNRVYALHKPNHKERQHSKYRRSYSLVGELPQPVGFILGRVNPLSQDKNTNLKNFKCYMFFILFPKNGILIYCQYRGPTSKLNEIDMKCIFFNRNF